MVKMLVKMVKLQGPEMVGKSGRHKKKLEYRARGSQPAPLQRTPPPEIRGIIKSYT